MAKNSANPTLLLITYTKQYTKWQAFLLSALLAKGIWDNVFSVDLEEPKKLRGEMDWSSHKQSIQFRYDAQQTAGLILLAIGDHQTLVEECEVDPLCAYFIPKAGNNKHALMASVPYLQGTK